MKSKYLIYFIYLLTVFHAQAPFQKGNHLKAQSNKSEPKQKPQTINIKYFKCSMVVTTHYKYRSGNVLNKLNNI